MNILVKWPTRGCAAGLKDRLAKWIATQSKVHKVTYVVLVDHDDGASVDAAMEIGVRPDERGDWFARAEAIMIPAAGKVHACNAEIGDAVFKKWDLPWDILVLASDDMVPQMHGWDEVISRAMRWHFPALDGMIHLNDGYMAAEKIVTLPIMGRNYYQRFGYIYHPSYQSLYCDNEQTLVARALSKIAYIDLPVFQHRWRGEFARDETLKHNEKIGSMQDCATFARRKESMIPPTPLISILMCALDSRRPENEVLMAEIYRQIWALPNHWDVELHVCLDQKRLNVGEKRQALMERARGKYVCFIDDDDAIAPDYVKHLVDAAAEDADCIVFYGQHYVDGALGLPFDFDLKYSEFRNTPQQYERTPNHLCPVRRELARQVIFAKINCGEDVDYARRLRPLLKTQAVCRDADGDKKLLYHYRFRPMHSETQKRPAGPTCRIIKPGPQFAAVLKRSAHVLPEPAREMITDQ